MTGDSAGDGEIRTFIWGSCVSRDTFGFLPETFTLRRYVARQSLISAGNSASGVKEKLTPIASKFQQRMVEGDLHGDLFASLRAAAPDLGLVIIDLIDERGGVIHFADGYATKLNEFWAAGGRAASRGAEQVQFGTDEHFEAWRTGAVRLVRELEQLDLLKRTVALSAPWAATYEDGSPLEIPGWMMDPAEADAAYARYFDHLAFLGVRVLELPKELATSSREHQWGASPFHYQTAAYEYFSAAIQEALEGSSARSQGAEVTPPPALARRNTAAWGQFTEVHDVSDVAGADLSSGLLTLWQRGTPFDVLIDDIGASTTLVSFHAALGASGLEPPIFTARSVSSGIGVNRIYVSDPGLLMADDLGIAWYLGTSQVDATSVLVSLIAALQERLGAEHLVFFGMSAGGFAALNLSHEFPGSLAIPVNPQTRILDYAEEHWDDLGRQCFGADSAEESRALLDAHPRADLRKVYAKGFGNSVIYVQNAADGHTTTQLIPWFDAIGWSGDASILFGTWGNGHVPPPGPELRAMLSALPAAAGDWRELAGAWGADTAPTRESVRARTGR